MGSGDDRLERAGKGGGIGWCRTPFEEVLLVREDTTNKKSWRGMRYPWNFFVLCAFFSFCGT